MAENATIIDIARKAGVSTRAVSSALNGTGRVSDTTRNAIRKIAVEMSYQPRLAAQLMRARSTGGIGVIIPADQAEASESGAHGPLMTNFLAIGEAESVRFHFDFVSMAHTPTDCIPQSFKGAYVDGAIVTDSMSPVPALREYLMSQDRYPWVCINEEAPHCVMSDFTNAANEAIGMLVDLGHRRIATATGPPDFRQHNEARLSFERAARAHNMEIAPHRRGLFPYSQRRIGMSQYVEWATEILAGDDYPTAFLCSDMRIGRAIIYAALSRGLQSPKDVTVVGMGTAGDAEKGYPCMTAIEPDFRALVERSYAMLRGMIAGENVRGVDLVPAKLVHRDSVA
ncbi:MAG TPA: LacI family DNA-binding transcriptional regulator [Capsulimonadaceae bacterium]|jgi:LacI family transcriptional regulator